MVTEHRETRVSSNKSNTKRGTEPRNFYSLTEQWCKFLLQGLMGDVYARINLAPICRLRIMNMSLAEDHTEAGNLPENR